MIDIARASFAEVTFASVVSWPGTC